MAIMSWAVLNGITRWVRFPMPALPPGAAAPPGALGPVTAANSLTGPSVGDSVGGATALANGNYLVSSPYWDNHAPFAADAGAVTFCGSASGCVGTVTSANSLIGSTGGDNVGNNNNIVLSNGNYVVLTPSWNNGATADVGAATFCNGATGCAGTISPGNSLLGSSQADQVGTLGVALTAGKYLVLSPNWKNNGISRAGAITRSGPSGITGTVTPANSLVGSTMDDAIGGFGETTALPNGDYIVRSTDWDNAGIVDAGAISYGVGNGGTVGALTAANSVRGLIMGGGAVMNFSVGSANNDLVVGRPSENLVTVFKQSGIPFTAASRKTHGAKIFDINLPSAGDPGVECRSGGATNDFRIIFTFPGAVTFNNAFVSSGTGGVSSSSGSGNATVTVDVTGVTNAQVITVTLTNVHSGSTNVDVTVSMGVLLGDTTGNGSVNSSDVSLTKSKSGETVDASNFRSDVTLSDSLNSSDVSLVKSKSGTALPVTANRTEFARDKAVPKNVVGHK
jgi:uncharacterized protein DUF5650